MDKAVIGAVMAAALSLAACAGDAGTGTGTGVVGGADVLGGTYWYVPPAFLPALSFDPGSGTAAAVSDQTVWLISQSAHGYFWGQATAVFSGANAGMAGRQPNCSQLAGSVTPSGDVLISFVSKTSTITGTGHLMNQGHQPVFRMQMNSGKSTMILHWADMAQCRQGEACWDKLPGSDLGIEAFMAQCTQAQ